MHSNDKTDNFCMPAEGASALSEALKVNTALATLRLGGVHKQQFNSQNKKHGTNSKDKKKTVTGVGDEEALALSEALKINTTLSSLSLGSVRLQHHINTKQGFNSNNGLNSQQDHCRRSTCTERGAESQHNTDHT